MNVANVDFHLKEASCQKTADYAIKKFLQGQFCIVPGFAVKLAIWTRRFASDNFLAKILYNVQKIKMKNK